MQNKSLDSRVVRTGSQRASRSRLAWRQWLVTGTLATTLMACQTAKKEDPYGDAWGDPYGGGYNPYPTDPATAGPGGYPDTSGSAQQPAYTPPPEPAYTPPPATTRSHTVAKGDTLWSISQRYGTTVSAIQQANGLSSNLIIIGQTLRIP